MEELKIILFEFLLGYVLQGFGIVLGIYVFNRQKINMKSYVLSSILVIVVSYLVRLLPISFGVHTIINMLFLFLICIIVLKMPGFSTIRSALLVTVILLICEMTDVAVMMRIFGKTEFENMMLDTLQKAVMGFPGVVFFVIIMILGYFTLTNKEKGENNGRTSA
jgi:hypothetical protein